MTLQNINQNITNIDDYIKDLSKTIQYNFDKLNKLVLKDGVSGILTINLGSGSNKLLTIEIINGLITNISISNSSNSNLYFSFTSI